MISPLQSVLKVNKIAIPSLSGTPWFSVKLCVTTLKKYFQKNLTSVKKSSIIAVSK